MNEPKRKFPLKSYEIMLLGIIGVLIVWYALMSRTDPYDHCYQVELKGSALNVSNTPHWWYCNTFNHLNTYQQCYTHNLTHCTNSTINTTDLESYLKQQTSQPSQPIPSNIPFNLTP